MLRLVSPLCADGGPDGLLAASGGAIPDPIGFVPFQVRTTRRQTEGLLRKSLPENRRKDPSVPVVVEFHRRVDARHNLKLLRGLLLLDRSDRQGLLRAQGLFPYPHNVEPLTPLNPKTCVLWPGRN